MKQFSMLAAAALLMCATVVLAQKVPAQRSLAQMNVHQKTTGQPAPSGYPPQLAAEQSLRSASKLRERIPEHYEGREVDYWDDTGFTADGEFIDGVLHHAGMVLDRKE